MAKQAALIGEGSARQVKNQNFLTMHEKYDLRMITAIVALGKGRDEMEDISLLKNSSRRRRDPS